MYDIDTTNIKKGKKIYSIFLIAGIFFMLIMIGVLVSNKLKLQSLDSETISTRVEVNSYIDSEGSVMYRPTYYYKIDGREYACSSNSSSSAYPSEENKKVYYDSTNPAKCMTESSAKIDIFLIAFMIIPLLFIVIAIVNFKKINKRLALINELNQKGKLIKNLPYRLEDTGIVVNNVPIQRPVVDYTLSSGSTITLRGDPRHDKKNYDADGMVDLVIDESNPDNYFIDFEINRIAGNSQSDYYVNPQNNNNNFQI